MWNMACPGHPPGIVQRRPRRVHEGMVISRFHPHGGLPMRPALPILIATALAAASLLAMPEARAGELSCTLNYDMSGGGAFYKRSSGEGVVKCSDGKSLPVRIEAKGGGLTFGKSKIVDGIGKFSGVNDIRDVIGGYATAEANAGNSSNASKAQVVTKGSISLALTGKGTGWTLGVSFGSFIISER
jgi:hypothetical protein